MDPNSPANLPNPALTAALEAREAREVDVSPVPVNPGPVPTFTPLAPLAPVSPEVPAAGTDAPPFKVPGWLHGVAVALAAVCVPLLHIVPSPLDRGVAGVLFVASILAGLPMRVPQFADGRPLVPLALVPVVFSIGTAAAGIAVTLPAGSGLQMIAGGVVFVCGILTGKFIPMRGQ